MIPDTTSPFILIDQLSPQKGATDVDPAAGVSIRFSEAMKVDTLTESNIILTGQGGATCGVNSRVIPGQVVYDSSTNTATFRPTPGGCAAQGFDFFETINVTAKKSITDLAGNGLTADPPCPPPVEGACWSFKTGDLGDTTSPTLSGEIRCSDCSPGPPPESPTSFSLKLTWPVATDNATPAGDMTYEVCVRKKSAGSCADAFPEGFVPVVGAELSVATDVKVETLKGSACGTTCLKEVGALESGTEYLFGVRAVDKSGNASGLLTGGPAKTKPGSWVCIAFAPPDVLISDTTEDPTARRNQWERCRLDLEKTSVIDSFSPSIAMVGDAPYAAWISDVGGNHVYVRHYDTSVASPTWRSDFGSTSTGLNDPNKSAQQTRLAALGTKIYLAYIDFPISNPEERNIVVKRLDTALFAAGAEVTDWTTLPAVPAAGSAAQLAFAVAKDVGGNDLPTVAWIESGLKVKQLKGSDWVDPPNTDFTATGNPNFPALAANGPDIYFAWSDCPLAGHCQILVKRLDEIGGGTEIRINLPTTNSQTFSGQISLGFVGSTPHIAWVQSLDSRPNPTTCSTLSSNCLIFIKKLVDGTWQQVGSGAAATGRFPSLAGATSPYIAFQIGTGTSDLGRITVKHFNGSEWVTDRDENAFTAFSSLSTINRESINFFPDDPLDAGSDPAIAVSLSGVPHVAYLENCGSAGTPSCPASRNRPFVKRLK